MIYFLIFLFIFVLTMGYFFLMFFYPEWVGISGEKTEEAIQAHQEEEPKSTDSIQE